MTDYETEALAMCPNEPNHGGGPCSDCGGIAAALEAAEKRGRVAGLRAARDVADENREAIDELIAEVERE